MESFTWQSNGLNIFKDLMIQYKNISASYICFFFLGLIHLFY